MNRYKYVFMILILLFCYSVTSAQMKKKAKIALIQATSTSIPDLFVDELDMNKIHQQMNLHIDKLLELFEEAGKLDADLVCGPEDMQHIGPYGLHVDVKDPKTGKVLFNSLAVPVPGPLTDRIAKIAKNNNMYIIAPLYEIGRAHV